MLDEMTGDWGLLKLPVAAKAAYGAAGPAGSRRVRAPIPSRVLEMA